MSNNPNAYQQSSQMDTNIENYTLSEMLTILNLGTQPTSQQIINATDQYIAQANNGPMAQFFQDAQTSLLQYIQANPATKDNTYTPANNQVLSWWNNESLKQPNATQNSKITTRAQEIQLFGNEHVPMNRQQLGVNNNYNVGVAQDTLNPNLTNTTTRFVNLDSQFRQATSGVESAPTDYTLTLSEPLNNVLSMWLYSVHIPHTWYTYDTAYGNTCCWILFDLNVPSSFFELSIPPGNYTATDIVSILNIGLNGNIANSLSAPEFFWPLSLPQPSANFPISYNAFNGKITMSLNGGKYTDPISGTLYTIGSQTQIIFFDINSKFKCGGGNGSCSQNNTLNQSFGWYLGYRVSQLNVSAVGNQADTVINTFGPKYLIMVIDDYNQNHINNGLVTITEGSTSIKLPTYYNPTTPVRCSQPSSTQTTSSISSLTKIANINISYKKIPQVLPTAPRILTQAQIYTINEIQKNNETNTVFRGRAPTNPDIFALIPVKLNYSETTTTGTVYVEFSGSIQENKRVYFGPVNIERMRIKLLDDKGNLLNLNGADWSVTLICDLLYQY